MRLGSRVVDSSARLVMGIVNATPDSFYDAGRDYEFERALDHVAEMVGQGADIIDIGGVKAGLGEDGRPARRSHVSRGWSPPCGRPIPAS